MYLLDRDAADPDIDI